MAKLDVTGERSGLLVAIEFSHINKNHKAVWKCRCDCGNICYKLATKIRSKKYYSCGCAQTLKRCKICGAEINGGKVYCSEECRREGHLLRSKKAYNKKMENKAKKKTLSLLDQTLKELNEYNRENGTNISYGFFVHMKEIERLKNAK